MNKIEIFIPEGIFHLSDCKNIQSQFPQGSFILDKTITGCGATTMFLSDNIPTILCSARLELMHCKANAPEFFGKVHEFRKFGDYSSSVLTLENSMMDYVWSNAYPFSGNTPKILVSYDSFKHVAQALSDNNLLGSFRIVVDEAQTLFTDKITMSFSCRQHPISRITWIRWTISRTCHILNLYGQHRQSIPPTLRSFHITENLPRQQRHKSSNTIWAKAISRTRFAMVK